MYYRHAQRAVDDREGNKCDYWTVGTDGTADFHYSRVEQSEPNPHGLFDLGILYWNGTAIMPDKEKGVALIKKSAELNYKHAQKWLKKNL